MGHKCEGLHCGGCRRRHGPRVSGRGLAVAVVAVVVVLAAGGEAVARSRAAQLVVLAVVVLAVLAGAGGLVVVLARLRAEARRQVQALAAEAPPGLAEDEWRPWVEGPAWPEQPGLSSAPQPAPVPTWPLDWLQRGGRDG